MAGARFEGQVAVVTGAARGIGLATAALFAGEGAKVALVDLDREATEAGAKGLAAGHGGSAKAFACDITDEGEVDALFAGIEKSLGPVSMLVNNAGITRDNLLFKMSVDDWDSVIRVHLRGAFLCTRAAQRQMVARKFGKVVNLSSTSALGTRGQLNYASAKAGLQAFTRTAAVELGPFNINVNAVAPGFIDTEMTRKTAARLGLDPKDYIAQRAKGIPLGRVGIPGDVAKVIGFLCSEDAAYVSGQIIYVKGGPETTR